MELFWKVWKRVRWSGCERLKWSCGLLGFDISNHCDWDCESSKWYRAGTVAHAISGRNPSIWFQFKIMHGVLGIRPPPMDGISWTQTRRARASSTLCFPGLYDLDLLSRLVYKLYVFIEEMQGVWKLTDRTDLSDIPCLTSCYCADVPGGKLGQWKWMIRLLWSSYLLVTPPTSAWKLLGIFILKYR